MPKRTLNMKDNGERIRVAYGFDQRGLGFFASINRGKERPVEYDALSDNYRGLPGLLDALVNAHVFSRDQIQEALGALPIIDTPEDIEDPIVRQAAVIIINVKQAAGE